MKKGVPSRYLPGHNSRPRALERLDVRLVRDWVENANACHIWTGPKDRNGYGFVSLAGRRHMVHRLRYEREIGDIPAGWMLAHEGGQHPECCNPAHYEPATRKPDPAEKRARRNAISRSYAQRHPDRIRAATAHQRARRKAAPGKLSLGIVKWLLAEQAGRCAACDGDLAESGYHLDHIVPLSRGGTNEDANVQLLCPHCNLTKGAKLPEQCRNSA